MLLWTCGGQGESEQEAPVDPVELTTPSEVDELPPRPDYPRSRRGHLVTATAGDYVIEGSWRASAGFCEDIGVVEMYAGPQGTGVGLVMHIPESDPLGNYPVVAADVDFPEAPAALIAVQVFDDPDAYGFQAYTGELELTEIGESVSGRFATTMREIRTDMLTHFVGVFDDIALEALADDYCAVVRDSTIGVDSTAIDSTLVDSTAVDSATAGS